MASDGVTVVIIVKVHTVLYSGKKVIPIRWLVIFFFFVALQHKSGPSLLIVEVSRSCTILDTQNPEDSLNE